MDRIPVSFYRTAGGAEPVREWLRSLPAHDRRAIGTDLKRIQEQWPVGMPVCRPVERGLWEVRSNISDNRVARLLFCFHDGEAVVVHGFIKKSQKAPRAELELAGKRMKDVVR
jgi:phage-related protein